MRNSRSYKQHWELRQPAADDEPTYPHVATSPTWTQRRAMRIGLETPVCAVCGSIWPCIAYERDLFALEASYAVYWHEAGHAATRAAAAVGLGKGQHSPAHLEVTAA